MDLNNLLKVASAKVNSVVQSFTQPQANHNPIISPLPQSQMVKPQQQPFNIGQAAIDVGKFMINPANSTWGHQLPEIPKITLPTIQHPAPLSVSNGYNVIAKPLVEGLLNTPSDLISGQNQINRDQQSGAIAKPQTLLADIGKVGSPLLNIATLGGGSVGKSIATTAVKEAAPSIWKAALKSGIEGGGFGALYGALNGLANGRDMSLVDQGVEALKQGAQGFGTGFALGGTLGGASNLAGRFNNELENAMKKAKIPRDQWGQFKKIYGEKKLSQLSGTDSFVPSGRTEPVDMNAPKQINDWIDMVDKELGVDKINKEGGFIKFNEKVGAKDQTPLETGSQTEQFPNPEQPSSVSNLNLDNNKTNISSSNRMDTNNPLLNHDNSINSGEQINQSQSLQQPLSIGQESAQSPYVSQEKNILIKSDPQLSTESTPNMSAQTGQESISAPRNPSNGSISQVSNSESPYFNTNKLNISTEGKQQLNKVIQEVRPQIEQVVGKKLSNQEIIDTANNSSSLLNKVVDRSQTADFEARLLRTRQQLAAMADSGTVNKEYIDNLMAVKSHATDIARKLQSFSIGADPKLVTSKDAILEAVLKVEKDSNKVIEAAKGVDFNNLKEATDFYRKFIKPSRSEWIDLVRYNSMLSSPNTHINNAFSNVVNSGVVAPIEKTLTGTIDFLGSKITGKEQSQFAGEGPAYAKGYFGSLHDAAHAFADVMRGNKITGNLDVRQIPLSTDKNVSNLNLPTRLLEASDQFFTALTKGGEESALNLRKSKGVNVGNIETQALDNAKYRLFRSELHSPKQGVLLNGIDEFTGLIQQARNSKNPITSNIAKYTLPFVQTPMNILKQGIEYSPAGLATLPGAANKTEQLSKAILGSSGAAATAMLVASGRTTWAEPTNPTQKADFRAAGLQPYALKIGDKWISYAKLPPAMSFPIAIMSALRDAEKNKLINETQVNVLLNTVAKTANFYSDQSYVKNIGDFVAFTKGDAEAMTRFIGNYPQQWVPYRALLGWMARLTDPVQRKVDTNSGLLNSQLQNLLLQIPLASRAVPARLDTSGQPIPNQNAALNAFSPLRVTTERSDQKQIYDLKQKSSLFNKNVKAAEDMMMKGQPVNFGDIASAAEKTTTNPVDVLKLKAQEDVARNKAKLTGSVETVGNKIFYGDKSIDLSPPTKGQGIDAFTNQNWTISKSLDVWKSGLPESKKQELYKKLGVDPQDVRYAYLASHNTDVSTQYIESRSPTHEKLINNLYTGRVVGINGQQFASNAVIDALRDKGKLTDAEAKALKTIKMDKKGNSLNKATGKAKKGKVPTLKAASITLKKPSSKEYKIGTPKKLAVQNVNFNTPFTNGSTSVSVPNFKAKVRFNVGH